MREGLVQENKGWIAQQAAHERQATLRKSESAQLRSHHNRVQLAERDPDTERFARQQANLDAIRQHKKELTQERAAEQDEKMERARERHR